MYEIQISFKDKKNKVLNYVQYAYDGKKPKEEGIEKAKRILNHYFKDLDEVTVEVFSDGNSIKSDSYKKSLLLSDDFYFIIKNIISRQNGGEEHCNSSIITSIKKELEKVRSNYE